MDINASPVDVICLCDADGTIRPLRLRMEDEEHMLVRADVEETLDSKCSMQFGAEFMWFLCRAKICGRFRILEIKYSVRNHSWSILHGKM